MEHGSPNPESRGGGGSKENPIGAKINEDISNKTLTAT